MTEHKVEILDKGNKSFEGIVEVYDETFYVNTETGAGLDSIIKKIDPLLNKMTSGTYISGYDFNDIKQELVIIAIDGINSYDPDKNVKLSTFLHIHLKNKLISKLRSENKMSNDAFGLHEKNSQGDGVEKIKRIREEIFFSACTPAGIEDPSMMFENTLGEEESLYGQNGPTYADLDFQLSLGRLADHIDPKTVEIIKLIYYKDFTIKKAAEEVGLTGWAASMRLKKLSENKAFLEAFGDFI